MSRRKNLSDADCQGVVLNILNCLPWTEELKLEGKCVMRACDVCVHAMLAYAKREQDRHKEVCTDVTVASVMQLRDSMYPERRFDTQQGVVGSAPTRSASLLCVSGSY